MYNNIEYYGGCCIIILGGFIIVYFGIACSAIKNTIMEGLRINVTK